MKPPTGQQGNYSWYISTTPFSPAKWLVLEYHNPETLQDDILADGLVRFPELVVENTIKTHKEAIENIYCI